MPRLPARTGLSTALVAVLLVGSACKSSPAPRFLIGSRAAPDEDIRVEVVNDNYLDMGVFVMMDGVNFRLGDVVGKHTDSFTLDPTRISPSQGLRLLADPVGSRNVFLSDEVSVNPGVTVVFNISPNLQQSYVILR